MSKTEVSGPVIKDDGTHIYTIHVKDRSGDATVPKFLREWVDMMNAKLIPSDEMDDLYRIPE